MKTLTNYESCTESRIRISLLIPVSVIGRFSPVIDHLSLDGGKIRINIHVIEGFRNNFQNHPVPEQVTGGFLNNATSSLKRVPVRILIISEKKSSLFCLVLQILSGYIMRKVVLSLLLRG